MCNCCGESRGLCTFPHGSSGLATLLLALITSSVASSVCTSCYFVTVETSRDIGPLENVDTSLHIGFTGHERVPPDDTFIICEPWSDVERDFYFDGAWWVATLASYAGAILCFVVFIAAIHFACMVFDPNCLKANAATLFAAAALELLSFLAFASKFCDLFECKFSISAGFAIAAPILCIMTGILFCRIPPEGDDYYSGKPIGNSVPSAYSGVGTPGSVEVLEEVFPDGTKKTTRTTVNPDGSLTVEETTEQPQGVP